MSEQDQRQYQCEECPCGRELVVARVTGGFLLTLYDPEFKVWEFVSPAALGERLAEQADDDGEIVVSDGLSQAGIILSEQQGEDLSMWALGRDLRQIEDPAALRKRIAELEAALATATQHSQQMKAQLAQMDANRIWPPKGWSYDRGGLLWPDQPTQEARS